MGLLRKLYLWLDSRLRLKPVEVTLLYKTIPGGASWIYVFGSVTLFFFLLQVITGMFLVIYYVPTPDHAYDSIQYIMKEVTFGTFVRGLHHWGASAMMVAIGLHMLQTYLYGAYKPPRELMWIVGVALLLLTLAFGFSGYLLPWDQKAYWATRVGVNMVGTIPGVGDLLSRIIRGGETFGALTLSRFFALHVLFLPALVVGLIGLHLFILWRVGPAGPWDEAKARDRREAFYPRQVFMDAVAMGLAFIMVVAMVIFLPVPLADKANPADSSFTPVPEWYFLWYYQLLKYIPGPLEPLGAWILPMLLYLLFFAVPFIDRNPERSPVRRPMAVGAGIAFLAAVFTFMGVSLKEIYSLPSPDPAVVRGKELYSGLGCVGCHRIHDQGGTVGPDLSFVGQNRDREWLIHHFLDPQALVPGSMMPAYPLPEDELEDLTAYMLSLK
jgi:ubiquinol-cytochrome c reductase cytochrome b subunit